MKPSVVWDINRIPVERESRMKKRIYRNMCLVTLVAILFSAILTSFLYYQNLEKQMRQAAADLNFEQAAQLRDKMIEFKKNLADAEN